MGSFLTGNDRARHRAPGPARLRAKPPSRGRRLLTVVQSAALIVGLAIVAIPSAATADTPYTFMDENFDSPTFPPTDWEITSGNWTRSCAPASPSGGCYAVDTITSPDPVSNDQLLFKP